VALASLMTIVIEVVFRQIQPVDDLVDPLNDRLRVVGDLLLSYTAGNAIEKQTETKLVQYAMTGTSRLRNVLLRSHYQEDHRNRMSTIVALAGRLIDLASTLSEVKPQPDEQDRERMKILAERLQIIRQDLKSRCCPPASEQDDTVQPSAGVPLLPELERTVTLILQALAGTGPGQEYLPSMLEDAQGNRVFREDTLSNPEHLKFALKGCLAGMLCYIIYTSIDWPGISTALATW
jgi:multidrug resistance protein MdtO